MRLDVPAQSRRQPEVVEHRRPQIVHEEFDLIETVAHQPSRRVDALSHVGSGGAQRLLRHVEVQQCRGERLAGLVVELPADPAPLVLDGLEDLRRVGARLVVDPLQHVADGTRHLADGRLALVLGERPAALPLVDEREGAAELDEVPERPTQHEVVDQRHDATAGREEERHQGDGGPLVQPASEQCADDRAYQHDRCVDQDELLEGRELPQHRRLRHVPPHFIG